MTRGLGGSGRRGGRGHPWRPQAPLAAAGTHEEQALDQAMSGYPYSPPAARLDASEGTRRASGGDEGGSPLAARERPAHRHRLGEVSADLPTGHHVAAVVPGRPAMNRAGGSAARRPVGEIELPAGIAATATNPALVSGPSRRAYRPD